MSTLPGFLLPKAHAPATFVAGATRMPQHRDHAAMTRPREARVCTQAGAIFRVYQKVSVILRNVILRNKKKADKEYERRAQVNGEEYRGAVGYERRAQVNGEEHRGGVQRRSVRRAVRCECNNTQH